MPVVPEWRKSMPHILQHAIAIANKDEIVRDSFSVLLAGAGYSVSTYATGAALISALLLHKPSVVLLDSQLPDFSLSGLLKNMSVDTGSLLPTIVMANHAKELPNLDHVLAAAGSVLFKPIEERQLFAAIDKALCATDHSTADLCHW